MKVESTTVMSIKPLWQSPKGNRVVTHWASMPRLIWPISEYNLTTRDSPKRTLKSGQRSIWSFGIQTVSQHDQWKIWSGIVYHKSWPQNMCHTHSWPQQPPSPTIQDYSHSVIVRTSVLFRRVLSPCSIPRPGFWTIQKVEDFVIPPIVNSYDRMCTSMSHWKFYFRQQTIVTYQVKGSLGLNVFR